MENDYGVFGVGTLGRIFLANVGSWTRRTRIWWLQFWTLNRLVLPRLG